MTVTTWFIYSDGNQAGNYFKWRSLSFFVSSKFSVFFLWETTTRWSPDSKRPSQDRRDRPGVCIDVWSGRTWGDQTNSQMYQHIYIRCIVFSWHVCIPEHYHCSLMRSLRDVDLHRSTTRRRRHVELPNLSVYIPVHDTSVSCPQHTPNEHMTVVSYSETTTTETAYIIQVTQCQVTHSTLPRFWSPLKHII